MTSEERAAIQKELVAEREAMDLRDFNGEVTGERLRYGVSGGPMNTISSILLDPANVRPEDICLYDIAHPLSFLCRGVGQVKQFLSVGQHCINCAREAEGRGYSDRVTFACLLHDGSEAYCSDVIRPVKVLLTNYKEVEAVFQEAIYEHFGLGDLSVEERELVRLIDDAMLWNEAKILFSHVEELEPPLLATVPDFRTRSFREVEDEYTLYAVNLLQKLSTE